MVAEQGFTDTALLALIPDLRRFGCQFVRNKNDLDDLVQTIVCKALEHRDSFDPDREGELLAWLFQIMKNFCVDKSRRRKVEAAGKLQLAMSAKHLNSRCYAPSRALAALTLKDVVSGMELLQKATKEAVLRAAQGESMEEISAAQGAGVGTVKSRISRGRAVLKELLCEEFA